MRMDLLAVLSGAGWIALAALSPQFVWGQDHSSRPVLAVLGLLAFEWFCFALAVRAVSHMQEQDVWIRKPWWLLGIGVLFWLPFLGRNPILEHDAYRYLWDGAMLVQGISPYRHAPAEILEPTADPGSSEAAALRQLADHSPEARRNLERVGYPHVKTIYPPVAQAVFAMGYLSSGWSWDGLRLLFGFAYFVGAGLIVRVFWRDTPSGRPAAMAAVLLGWCPLAVKEIASSAHLDGLLVLVWGWFFLLLARRDSSRPSVTAGVGVVLGLGILTKLYPVLLLLPIWAWFQRRNGWRSSVLFALTAVTTTVLGYLPFLVMDGMDVFSGFRTFSNEWLRNAGLYALVEGWMHELFGTGPVSMPGWVGGTGPAGTVVAKLVVQVAVMGTILAFCWRFLRSLKVPSFEQLARACLLVLCVWFLLLPMAFPWYLLGLLPFAVASGTPAFAYWLAAFVSLGYYALFYCEYHEVPSAVVTAVKTVEYLVPVGVAVLLFRRHRRGFRNTTNVPDRSAMQA